MAEKKIGDREFRVDQPLATEALLLQTRVLKVLGSAGDKIPDIIESANSGSEDSSAIVTTFAEFFKNCDPSETVNLIKDIVEMAEIRRPSGVYESVSMDADFSGSQKEMFQVAFFILKEVFGDFLGVLGGNGILAKKAAD